MDDSMSMSMPMMEANWFAQYSIPANGVRTLTATGTLRFLLVTIGANVAANGMYIVTMAPGYTTTVTTIFNSTGTTIGRAAGKLTLTNSINDINYANLFCLGTYSLKDLLTAS